MPAPPPPADAVAVVFPGQGSQRRGMAKDFHEKFSAAREVFAEASDAADLNLEAICFEEDERLNLTEFTQPAILTAEMAMLRVLSTEFGLAPHYFGGHSLGEYTALCAAGVVSLADAVKIVRRRGALMQAAVPSGEGAMAAVIGEGVADRPLAGLADGVDVANRNSIEQVVISGPAAGVKIACEKLTGGPDGAELRVVPLNVSAPFHSHMMRGIEGEFRAVLDEVTPRFESALASCVTSNLGGKFHSGETSDLVDALVGQISGTVDWIANMTALGDVAHKIYEVGPNRPLRGFFSHAGIDITSVISLRTAEKGLRA